MPAIKTILVPVDFSPGSNAAVEYATFLANAFQAVITLLHVYPLPSMLNSMVPGADNRDEIESASSSAVVELERLRTEVLQRAAGEVRTLVDAGLAATAILDHARTGQFDLIVMGTHGRTGFQRLLMGSVAEAVIRRADRPVVIVHIPGAVR